MGVRVKFIDNTMYITTDTQRMVVTLDEARTISAELKKQLRAVSYPRMSTLDPDLLLLLKSFGVTNVKQLRKHTAASLVSNGVPHTTALWLVQWVAPRRPGEPVRLTPPRESPRWPFQVRPLAPPDT